MKAEILQAKETTSLISTAMAKIISRLNPTTSMTVMNTSSHTTSSPPTPGYQIEYPYESITRLPKLDLLQFSGNPFDWQPFWDFFQVAVDSNKALSGAQKLSYLHAKLWGETSRVTGGFQLTNTS